MKLVFHSKKALITGVDGFTGQHLKKRLEDEGVRVFGTTHNACSCPDTFVADLLDKDSIQKVVALVQPDYVIHLAAISFVDHGDATDFYRVNVVGTENLLTAIVDSNVNVNKVLIASSANVYGNTSSNNIKEITEPQPVNHYACSKMAMERIVATYFEKLPIILTRPFNYTGVGQTEKFLVPKIVSHFKRGMKAIELGNIDVYRDFSSVGFVVNSYLELLLSNYQSSIFNICSGNSYSLSQIIEYLEDISGYKIEVRVNQSFVRRNEVKTIAGDNAKLLEAFPELSVEPLEGVLNKMFFDGWRD